MTNQAEYQYDVFISYSHVDRAWVESELLPQLEAAGLKVIIDYRDFEVGVPSLVSMEQAVETSRHTLILLTPAWIQSEWTEFESLLVSAVDPAARRRKLIPLLLKPCALPSRIAILNYADFTDLTKRAGEMARLLAALGSHVHEGIASPVKQGSPGCNALTAVPIQPPLITESDLDELSNLLTRSGRAVPSARKALCIKIGIEATDLDFITGTADRDFALQLVTYLHSAENFQALLALCDAIVPVLKGDHAQKLQRIRAALRERAPGGEINDVPVYAWFDAALRAQLGETVAEQAEQIGAALETLAMMLPGSETVKTRTDDFREDFEHARDQIDALFTLKQLHDLFDRLEPLFQPIINYNKESNKPWKRIKKLLDTKSTGTKEGLQSVIPTIIDMAKQAQEYLPEDIQGSVDSVWQALYYNTEDSCVAQFEQAVHDFSPILNQYPAIISNVMFIRLKTLRLSPLAHDLGKVASSCDQINADNGKIIRQGAGALNTLDDYLYNLVMCHNSMQNLDKELKLVRSRPSRSAWEKTYEVVKTIETYCQCQSWKQDLKKQADKINQIYKRPGEPLMTGDAELPKELEYFRSLSKNDFSNLDKCLKALCAALDATVRKPLEKIEANQ